MKSVTADDEVQIHNVVSLLRDSEDNIFDKDIPEIEIKYLRAASIIQTEQKILDSLTLDKHLIQTIQALDDAHTSLNLISERLCTWHAHTTGESRVVIDELLSKKSLQPPLSNLKQTYLQVQDLIEILSNHIDEEAPKIFPAMVELLDSQLTVRLVSCAGSLAKLARLPSSTIQLLGAEKALFRHISDGSLPPKHGILYQHPSVKSSKRKNKGRVTRSLASKVAIAAKIDYYREKDE
ncbi:MAG: hypothetical protein VYE32_01890 [Candidatus Thermoplasmatota archaeon]|nr:hypothetical protein [Candidatus Thermoplasmatota archaeon]